MNSASWLQMPGSAAAAASLLRTRGPELLTVVFALLIGVQLASILTDFFGAADAPSAVAVTPESPRSGASRTVDVDAIINAHLFGISAQAEIDPSQAPVTNMSLVLAGLLAEDDPKSGAAIIGETAANAKLVMVGNAISGNARLHAVYADRAIIERGGALEALVLPRQLSSTPPPFVGNAAAGSAAVVDRVRSALAQNPGVLGDIIRPQQVMVGGKQRGFRVYPGRNPGAFLRLGLRPGDLITEINGTPLDDPARGEEIFSTLGSAAEVRVSVMRNGRPNEMVLNLSQIANEAQQIIPADGVTAVEATPQLPPPTGND